MTLCVQAYMCTYVSMSMYVYALWGYVYALLALSTCPQTKVFIQKGWRVNAWFNNTENISILDLP